MNISKKLNQNNEYLKEKLPSQDITFLQVAIGSTNAILIFANDLVNKESIGELILRPASFFKGKIWSEGCRVCDSLLIGWW